MGGETYFVTLSEYIEADVEFNGRAFVFAFMLWEHSTLYCSVKDKLSDVAVT